MIEHRGQIIADTRRAVQTLETSHPPSYYIHPDDIAPGVLRRASGSSLCEWKGEAVDFDLVDGPGSVAWCYPRVFPEFAEIAGWFAFYPSRLECFLADERVRPQPGGYYGGWLTQEIVGPVKGEPGITR